MPISDHVFIIAEAGSNWRCGTSERDIRMAKTLIDIAADAGADAVKFQTYRSETVYVSNAGEADYLSEGGTKQSITDIFEDLSMPYGMIPTLAEHCASRNIKFMSSVFSVADAAVVDQYVAVHKIASYEISHTRLLEFVARSGKPLILSTGAADNDDIQWALDYFRSCGGTKVVVLQCTAKYPAPLTTLNLRAIPALMKRFNVTVGLSDHSRDPFVGPVGAVALGARVIEKHFTLDNRLPGPDHCFALTPVELKQMVTLIRRTEQALGNGNKIVQEEEQELRRFAHRSIQATHEIRKGDVLREGANIDILRPGKQRPGVHPKFLCNIEGKKATRGIPLGDGIREGDFE